VNQVSVGLGHRYNHQLGRLVSHKGMGNGFPCSPLRSFPGHRAPRPGALFWSSSAAAGPTCSPESRPGSASHEPGVTENQGVFTLKTCTFQLL